MNAFQVMELMSAELGDVPPGVLARATARLLTEAERQKVEVTRENMAELFQSVSIRMRHAAEQTEAVVTSYRDIMERKHRGDSVAWEELNQVVERAYRASSAALELSCTEA